MRIRAWVGAATLGLAFGLALPAVSEADHRHSRHCGHRYGYVDRYGYPSYGHRDYSHRGYGYGDVYRYAPPYYRYDPYYAPRRYYYAPPPVYVHTHRGVRCTRPHLSLQLVW